MTALEQSPPTAPKRLLTFWSGGWALLLAAIFATVVVTWRVGVIYDGWEWTKEGALPGPAVSNGFDLSRSLVPRGEILPTGLGRDNINALTEPATLTVDDVTARATTRTKYLVSGDRVVGVRIGEQTRAYPIRILNYHEIVNDTLGGVPIAVTYSPLCDAVMVFDRRVAGETVEFRHSGLVFQTNLLLYDYRAKIGSESLWSQLQARAIVGVAALEAKQLRQLPCELLPWSVWADRYPQTTVIDGRLAYLKKKIYGQNPYGSYFINGELKDEYPVSPLPPKDERPYMTRVLVLTTPGEDQVLFYPDLADTVDEHGCWSTTLAGHPATVHYQAQPDTAWVTWNDGPPADYATTYCFWYAYHALRSTR